jgi:hypothetical protein
MKPHVISLAALMALCAGSAQACERQTTADIGSSGNIILAQAGGSTSGGSSGNSTSGGGTAAPGEVNPRLAPPNAPEGPRGAGGTAGPQPGTTGTTGAAPAIGNNNTGTGGTNTDSGPIDPRATPPNTKQ